MNASEINLLINVTALAIFSVVLVATLLYFLCDRDSLIGRAIYFLFLLATAIVFFKLGSWAGRLYELSHK